MQTIWLRGIRDTSDIRVFSESETSFAGSCQTHQPQGHNIQICLNTKSVLRETRSYCKHLLTDHKKSTTVSTSSFFYQKRLSPCLSLTLHFSGSIKGVMKLITETAASWLRTYQGPALPNSHIQRVGWARQKEGKKASQSNNSSTSISPKRSNFIPVGPFISLKRWKRSLDISLAGLMMKRLCEIPLRFRAFPEGCAAEVTSV